MSNNDFFIGRQPIMDGDRNIYGYELLFRGGYDPNEAQFDSAEGATATVLHNAIMNLGLETVVGNHKAFINFPQSFFCTHEEPSFSNNIIVIEMLEDVEPTEEVIAGVAALKDSGYLIALDDFIFKQKLVPLIRLADLIKFDVQYVKLDNLPVLFNKVKKVTQAKIVAERVETKAMFNACKAAGADYFQGYFFAKPEIISGQQLSVNQLNLMQLLEKIADERINLDDLANVIEKDVGLSHKLMKFAEQYRNARMPSFSSLKEVMSLFGLKRVQSWATMLSLAALTDVLPEVFNLARVRAIFMRRLAQKKGLTNVDSYYLAGLFSLLDTLMGKALSELLAQLPINEAIKTGLIEGQGDYGELLAIAQGYESIVVKMEEPGVATLYFEALAEASKQAV